MVARAGGSSACKRLCTCEGEQTSITPRGAAAIEIVAVAEVEDKSSHTLSLFPLSSLAK